jgi:UDP-N-acetylglucosamine acyltransferase
VIGPDVSINEAVRLIAHVNVSGNTAIGARSVIYPFASLGTPPQSVHYRGGPTRLTIGADCDIREGVTMNIGTEQGGGLTTVGERGFFMANSHVGHDCQVGNNVTFANGATLGGHVSVGDYAFLGGFAAIHQFARIGEGAMIGGVSGVRRDVIPFGMVSGQEATLQGLNLVGLKRRGYSREDLRQLRRAYRALFFGPGTIAERLPIVASQFAGNALAAKIIDFIRNASSRHFTLPPTRGRAETDNA